MFTMENFNKAKSKYVELSKVSIDMRDYRTNSKQLLKQDNVSDFAMEEAENKDLKEYLDACELHRVQLHALRVFISKCEEHLNIQMALELIK